MSTTYPGIFQLFLNTSTTYPDIISDIANMSTTYPDIISTIAQFVHHLPWYFFGIYPDNVSDTAQSVLPNSVLSGVAVRIIKTSRQDNVYVFQKLELLLTLSNFFLSSHPKSYVSPTRCPLCRLTAQ
jgi:hypothetical protein